MVLFIALGAVVLIAIAVLSLLFFMLNKEQKKEDAKAVPLTDLAQLKKELSSGILDPQIPKAAAEESDIIPAFVPKVSLPTQEVQSPPVEDVYKKRVQELEDELLKISQKADGQSDEARQMIETLTKENEALKSQQADLGQAQQKLDQLQGEALNLKTENSSLQTQLESTGAQVRLLEEQMTVVKLQMGEEISRANATVSELNREKEALLSAPKPISDEALRQELDDLKTQHNQLKQDYENLDKVNQKLQYELIKARAQSSGLERVSFNYKNQLEDFFKKISAVQSTNDQLSQVKNRLEGLVQEVKLQNEELVQKDRLAQFELEKNRSQLITLEREYEDFKSRVQQKNLE